jgi:hypothetical protein
MNFAAADAIVKAMLYEGYVLYPYRPTSIKNQRRWTFGGVYPPGCSAAGSAYMETQCLVTGGANTRLVAHLRFLHPQARQICCLARRLDAWPLEGEPPLRPVASLQCGGRSYFTWDESRECEVRVPAATLRELTLGAAPLRFRVEPQRMVEPIKAANGLIEGAIVRSQAPIQGRVTIAANRVADGAYRIVIRVENTTPRAASLLAEQNAARLSAFMSTHLILGIEGGEFVSLIDPPPRLAEAASTCTNQSAWPVLVGEEGSHDTVLCSPIILYDHPRIASQSPGDLFDGTEIDEVLTLRILTMTDAEKREMAATDERARELLARTERLTEEQLLQLHGVMRSPHSDSGDSEDSGDSAVSPDPAARRPISVERVGIALCKDGGVALRVGAHVKLNPKSGGDVFDLVLAGQTGVIEAIEFDFDDRVHVAVTVNSDPGQDLGRQRLPGHRFFFSPDEIECLPHE